MGGDVALLLLDLSDPDALRFLRCAASSSGAVGQAPHVLALLPGMAAARSVRETLANFNRSSEKIHKSKVRKSM